MILINHRRIMDILHKQIYPHVSSLAALAFTSRSWRLQEFPIRVTASRWNCHHLSTRAEQISNAFLIKRLNPYYWLMIDSMTHWIHIESLRQSSPDGDWIQCVWSSLAMLFCMFWAQSICISMQSNSPTRIKQLIPFITSEVANGLAPRRGFKIWPQHLGPERLCQHISCLPCVCHIYIYT